jgi:hypothetical protein
MQYYQNRHEKYKTIERKKERGRTRPIGLVKKIRQSIIYIYTILIIIYKKKQKNPQCRWPYAIVRRF